MRYAATIDGPIVQSVIVVPDGADPETYPGTLGLMGVWVDAGEDAPLASPGWGTDGSEFAPPWVQIAGADLGPDGAASGHEVGARVWHAGAIRVSRVLFNVTEPLDDLPSAWSRADGRYVVPAGWQYQPGEDVTEDGVTWFRVVQATSFAPSASPAQWARITGPGGDIVSGPVAWAQPTGAHDAYPAGAVVSHNGKMWLNTHGNGNIWPPGVFGWQEIAP